MTGRFWRHSKPKARAALFALPIPFIGWLSGTCFLTTWRWASEPGKMLATVFALASGITLALLCLLVATEISIAYRRWMAEQADEDRKRCYECDGPLKPAIRHGTGNLLCLPCARAQWASAEADLPSIARKAGA